MMKRGANRRRSISLLPFLIAGLLYLVYGTVLCGSRRGQTVGMMAVGVRAVRDGHPRTPGLRQGGDPGARRRQSCGRSSCSTPSSS